MYTILMKENILLRVIYTLFLGVTIALFVGFGMETFYETPKPPEYLTGAMYEQKFGGEPNSQDIERQKKFDQEMKAYDAKRKEHSQNTSVGLLVLAVVLTAAAIMMETRLHVLPDGIMLGGLLTLLYSLMRGADAGNPKYMFTASAVALAIVMYLGYHRFMRAPLVHNGKKVTPV